MILISSNIPTSGSLFPWIEEVRQKVIARYDRRLTVDRFQRDLGAKTVEDIEFGGIVKQLISTVQPREGDFLRAMWNMRNDLAHRKPAAGSDLKQALDLVGRRRSGLCQKRTRSRA